MVMIGPRRFRRQLLLQRKRAGTKGPGSRLDVFFVVFSSRLGVLISFFARLRVILEF